MSSAKGGAGCRSDQTRCSVSALCFTRHKDKALFLVWREKKSNVKHKDTTLYIYWSAVAITPDEEGGEDADEVAAVSRSLAEKSNGSFLRKKRGIDLKTVYGERRRQAVLCILTPPTTYPIIKKKKRRRSSRGGGTSCADDKPICAADQLSTQLRKRAKNKSAICIDTAKEGGGQRIWVIAVKYVGLEALRDQCKDRGEAQWVEATALFNALRDNGAGDDVEVSAYFVRVSDITPYR
eukprot:jgi/Bigna1/136668/aug1.35_g11376